MSRTSSSENSMMAEDSMNKDSVKLFAHKKSGRATAVAVSGSKRLERGIGHICAAIESHLAIACNMSDEARA